MKIPRTTIEIHVDTTELTEAAQRLNEVMLATEETLLERQHTYWRRMRRERRRNALRTLRRRLKALPWLYIAGAALCGLAAVLTIVVGR